jgi:hypothetical protein
MAYIGRSPAYGAFEKQTIIADSSTTTFALNFTVGSSSSVLVSVAGVIQEPEIGYSLSGGGANIIFSTAPTSGDTVFVIFLGLSRDVGDLSIGAITNKTALTTGVQGADTLLIYDDSATTLKKINLDDLIIGQTELSAAPADDDVLLVYDTSATEIKKIQSSNLVGSSLITGKTELSETPASDDLFLVFDTSTSSLKKLQKSFLNPTLTYASGTATGDGSTVAFSINSGRTVEDVVITVNGFHLTPTVDYTISGTTLTFQTAPAASAEISIRYLAVPGAYSHADYVGDGSTTGITINAGRTVDDVIVIVNGLQLVPTIDYTIASTTLTFQTAPAASAEITVRYLRLS